MIKIINGSSFVETFEFSTPNSKLISCDNVPVGIIDYIETDEYVKIMYIQILDEHRRQGIAGKVIETIKLQNRGKYMYGDSLPGAIDFWDYMGAEFDEDPDEDYLTPFHIEC